MIDESKLIFIISPPRSGSTLLQKLVSNNSYVDTASEPWLLLPLLGMYKPSLITAAYNYEVALKGVFDYLDKKGSRETFRNEIRELVLRRYETSSPENFFVDKTPRYYEMVDIIYGFFPKAKFLVLKRNPLAMLSSLLTTWSGSVIDPAKMDTYYRDFLCAPKLIQQFYTAHKDAPNVMEVKYESILADPATEVKAIYTWLGIPYSDEVLEVGNNEKVKGIYGDDVYKAEPLKKIDPALGDHWKSVLGDKKMAKFLSAYQEYLGTDFLKAYGYETEPISTGFSISGNVFQSYIDQLKKNGKI